MNKPPRFEVILILMCCALCFVIIVQSLKYNSLVEEYNSIADKANEMIEKYCPQAYSQQSNPFNFSKFLAEYNATKNT
jgi:hypothetical protein